VVFILVSFPVAVRDGQDWKLYALSTRGSNGPDQGSKRVQRRVRRKGKRDQKTDRNRMEAKPKAIQLKDEQNLLERALVRACNVFPMHSQVRL